MVIREKKEVGTRTREQQLRSFSSKNYAKFLWGGLQATGCSEDPPRCCVTAAPSRRGLSPRAIKPCVRSSNFGALRHKLMRRNVGAHRVGLLRTTSRGTRFRCAATAGRLQAWRRRMLGIFIAEYFATAFAVVRAISLQ
jgi:hypothetical protein